MEQQLPSGWSQHWDEKTSKYFYVGPDGRSTWEDPRSADALLPVYSVAPPKLDSDPSSDTFSDLTARKNRATEALARRRQELSDEALALEIARGGHQKDSQHHPDTSGDEALARRLAAESAGLSEGARLNHFAGSSRAEAEDAALARKIAQEQADEAYARQLSAQNVRSGSSQPHYNQQVPPVQYQQTYPPQQQVIYVRRQPQTAYNYPGYPGYYQRGYYPYNRRGGLGGPGALATGALLGAAGFLAADALLWGPGFGFC